MVWVQLALAVVLFVVGTLLRKGPDINPASFEDFGFPDVDPTKRVPVIWGKKRLKSVHTMEVQDYRTRKIKDGNFIKKVTVGYKYYCTLALGVCYGPDVTIHKIIIGDKVAWEGTASPSDAGTAITISDSRFFGKDNGIGGTVRVYPGSTTQTMNATLAAAHASLGGGSAFPDIPYRGICYLVFENFYWGNSPQIPQIEIVASRYPNGLGLGAARLINTTANESPTEGAVDISLPEIAYDILQNDDWGLAEANSDFDTTSFTDAHAILLPEGNAGSLVWRDGDSVRELLTIIMKQMDGFIFKRMATGLWEINLAREDYLGSPINSLPLFDETNSTLVSYSRGNWDETFNIVDVNWQDRNLKGRPQPAHVQDMANFSIQGVVNPAEFSFPACHSSTLAANLASRQLKATAFPLAAAEITTNRLAYNIVPGDVVRFAWDKLGISNIYMRVNSINTGTPEQGEIRLSLVQDVFGIADTVFSRPVTSIAVSQNPDPTAISQALVEDQSRFLATQDTDNPLFEEKPRILASAPQGNALEYIPHVKLTTESTYTNQEVEWSHAASGTIQSALAPADGDSVTIIVENVDDVADLVAAATNAEQKEQGIGMLVVQSTGSPQTGPESENEIMTYTGLSVAGSTVTLTGVNRGMEDTTLRRINAGDRVWFVYQTVGTSVSTYGDTSVIDIKLQNVATTGETDVSSDTNFGPFTFRRRLDRPIIPGGFEIGNANQSPIYDRYPAHILPTGDILLRWNRRDKLRAAMNFQTDADDPPTANYIVDVSIYGESGGTFTFLRTISGAISSTTYTKAQQYTDGVYGRYMFVLRSYDDSESPRLASLVETKVRIRRDPFLSPLPSPLPFLPNSPQSPRYGSPVASPLSPVQSPVSPVSPLSPGVFLSPRSPRPIQSPLLPSPHGFGQQMLSHDPLVWWDFQAASGNITNYGRRGSAYDLRPTGTPGTYAVRGRNATKNAFRFDGVGSDTMRMGNPSAAQLLSPYQSFTSGNILLAFRINDPTAAFGDWAMTMWDGFDDDGVAVRVSSVGGTASPANQSPVGLPSPRMFSIQLVTQNASAADYNWTFWHQVDIGDSNWHIITIKRETGESPRGASIFIDGVKAPASWTVESNAGAPRGMWFDQFDAPGGFDLQMTGRGNPFQNPLPYVVDEAAIFDKDMTDAQIVDLHNAYIKEVAPPLSPNVSPLPSPKRRSPMPSPISPVASPLSPLPSPISPVPLSPWPFTSPFPSPINSPFPSPHSPVPSPLSPVQSPISPDPGAVATTGSGYEGFIVSEAPDLYWPMNEAPDEVVGSPGEASPIVTHTVTEKVIGLSTTTKGAVVPGNPPLVRGEGEYSYGNPGNGGGELEAYIEAVDDARLDLANTWSLEFWMMQGKHQGVGGINVNRYIMRGTSTLEVGVWADAVSPNPGCLYISTPATTVASSRRVDDGIPHHIVLTQDVSGGNAPINIYIDGVLDSSTASIVKPPADTTSLYMLGRPNNARPRGMMAHCAIYSKTLTADDVLTHYMEGVRGSPYYGKMMKLAPTHWWRMWDEDTTQDAPIKDWGTAATDALAIFGPNPTDGPLQNQQSRALRMNDANDSPLTGAIGLPDQWHDSSPLMTSGVMNFWFRHKSGGSPREPSFRGLLVAADGTGVFAIRVNTSNQIVITMQRSGGIFATFTLDASLWPGDDVWTMFTMKADGVNPLEVFINGVRVDDGLITVSTAGGGASNWWIADVQLNTGVGNNVWTIGASRFNPAGTSPVDSNSLFPGDIAEWAIWANTTITDKDILDLYIASLGFRTLTEFMADARPTSLFEITDIAALDDKMGVMPDGTWSSPAGVIENMPLSADDPTQSVRFVRQDRVYVDFAAGLMSAEAALSSPVGHLPKQHTILVVHMPEDLLGSAPTDKMMLLTNTNADQSNLNTLLEIGDHGKGVVGTYSMDVFPGTSGKNGWLNTAAGTAQGGLSRLVGYIQDTSVRAQLVSPLDNTSRRMFIDDEESFDGSVSPIELTRNYVETMTAVSPVSSNLRLGDWVTNASPGFRNFGGLMSHVVAYDRALSLPEYRRIAYRRLGFQEHPLEIVKFQPSLYWRMNEPANPTSVADYSGNANNGTLNNGVSQLTFDNPAVNSNVWHEDAGVLQVINGSPRGAAVGVSTATVPVTNIATFPYTIGFWGRVSSTGIVSRAQITFSNNAVDTEWTRIGVRDFGTDDLRFEIQTNQTSLSPASESSNIAITQNSNEWMHIVAVFNGIDDIDAYVDGELVGTLTAFDPKYTPNRFVVGGFDRSTTGEGYNGDFHDVFVIDGTALTQEEIRQIYVSTFAPAHDRMVEALGATAHWKLNEIDGFGEYLNSIPDANGHYLVATEINTPWSPDVLVTPAGGPLPGYVDNAIRFPQRSPSVSSPKRYIDTAWTGYPTGGSPFSVSCWIRAASNADGVIWTYGTNANGQRPNLRLDSSSSSPSPSLWVAVGGGLKRYDFGAFIGLDVHAVVTFSPTASPGDVDDLSLYINGALQTPVSTSGLTQKVNVVATENFRIGADIAGAPDLADCVVSRVAVFPSELTTDQIRTLYLAGTVSTNTVASP